MGNVIGRMQLRVRQTPRLVVSLGATAIALTAVPIVHCPPSPLSERAGFGEAAGHLASLGASGPLFTVVWPPAAADAMHALPPSLRVADAVPDESTRAGERLAVVGPTGFRAPPELDGIEPLPRVRFEGIEIALFRYPQRDRVIFDLRRDLERAEVALVGPQSRLACDAPRSGGGHACPGRPDWNHVGPTILRVGGNDWPSVWAHPVEGYELVIDLGEQQLGDVIELDAALSDSAALTQGGAPVQIELEARGVARKMLRRTNEAGIATLALETPRRRARVTATIRTGKDARRHLGLNLRIIERAQQTGNTPQSEGRTP